MDHYKVLGIDKKASKSDIKDAFRRLALKFHPDKHSDSTKSVRDNATLRFKQASEAYEVLINDRKRADYNQNLNRRSTGGGYGYYDHHSYSYNRAPRYSASRWAFDLDATLRFMTTRAFLLNLAFAGVLLGGAVFIDSTGQALWNMQNSGKSFEEALETLEKKKREKDS